MELNIIYKNPLKVASRIAYVYPSLYEIMHSSLVVDLIYFYLNAKQEIYVERFCSKRLRGAEEPPRSLETRSPLKDFDLVVTSIHYEPDIVNLVRLLKAGGLSPFRQTRSIPVIAGGPVVMENPIPYSDIIDAFIIGEVETTIFKIVEKWLEFKDNKKVFLEELSKFDFVYVPGISDKEVFKAFPEDLNRAFYPVRQIVNTDVEPVFGKGFKLEVNRGCQFFCSFCMESRVMSPYRERSLSTLKDLIEKHLETNPYERRVVMYSLSFPIIRDHVRFLEFLEENQLIATLPSIRLNQVNQDLLDILKNLGQNTLTIAPESFAFLSQKLFFKYIKPCEWFQEKITSILDKGFNLKIYLIYGAPWDSLDLVRENVECIKSIFKEAKKRRRKIVISLNPLIAKPHTPFQHLGILSSEKLRSILKIYMENLRGSIEGRLYDIDWATVQVFLALSEQPLGDLIVSWAESGGGLSSFKKILKNYKNYKTSLKRVFVGYGIDEELPWGFIRLPGQAETVTRTQARIILSFISRERKANKE
ncbi:MAG: radical SAM protein [Thermosphaera sp.]